MYWPISLLMILLQFTIVCNLVFIYDNRTVEMLYDGGCLTSLPNSVLSDMA